MQTYSIEAAQNNLVVLAHLAAKGQEVLLTENNKPIARLAPLREDNAFNREVEKLRAFAQSVQPQERGIQERRFTAEEIERYQKRVEALRGSLTGIDTTLERDEDRV